MTTDYDLLVTSGVGPRESRRFVQQLAAHLEQLAERRGLAVVSVVVASGDEIDAPRSVTLRLRGDALASLGDECGTHVLVHRARGRSSRKRWFAAVTLHAAPDDAGVDATTIARNDLVITACRAGGPGGQHVNKVSSAVRVYHGPSGLAIRSAGARSQNANLQQALRRLAGLLRERVADRVAVAEAARRNAHYQLERGRAIRSYQLDADGVLVLRSPP